MKFTLITRWRYAEQHKEPNEYYIHVYGGGKPKMLSLGRRPQGPGEA